MMAGLASPLWQMIMLLVAGCFMLWELYRGWRAGVVRSGLQVAAMLLSTFIGYLAAQIASVPFGGLTTLTGIVVGCGVGLAVAIVVFVLVWILSAVLFKRTEHHRSGFLRFFWGLGGAFFGGIMGLFILWSLISMVRALGVMAEVQLRQQAQQPPSLAAHSLRGEPRPAQQPGLLNALVKAKASLELGSVGKVMEAADPVPPEVYQMIEDLGRLNSDRGAMQRFIEYPELKHVLNHPTLVKLLNDPDIIQAGEDRNAAAIAANPKLLQALQDPSLLAELEKIDWRAALKFALEKSPPSPSPSPAPR